MTMETRFDSLSSEEIEDVFVDTFVLPKMRDRTRFELRSQKKRSRFFAKLSRGPQGAASILMSELMSPLPRFAAEREVNEMSAWLKANGAGQDCYLMSYIKEIDRCRLSLGDAVVKYLNCPMEVVMICGEGLAVVQAERVSGPPPRFALRRGPVK
jgi:hypothetical protein